MARVLIVDDNPDQVMTLAELLRMEGHQVECATSGLYALSLARDFHPQYVILDIGMPSMNGYEALAKFKSRFPGAHFISITGRSGEERVASSAGFEAHVTKPVDFEVVRKLIQS
ncbi:MAG TPA: response regulator [Burkholderiales bacterium]|nr:response regulator [Burkholderiales bacterium]